MLAAGLGLAQSNGNSQQSPGQSQGQGSNQPPTAPAAQGDENDATLEIAPQPGAALPKQPGAEEIPGGRGFRQQDDTASVDPRWNPNTENGVNNRVRTGKPYLGIKVEFTTVCYQGGEEHGLEITEIDPNSPAQLAGLSARKGASGAAAAVRTLGALAGPLQMAFGPLVDKMAQDAGGDLIVAVDDHRVHNQAEFDNEFAQLKPGDTAYLTVIRPMPGGQHKTLKVAVTVGRVGQSFAHNDPSYNGNAAH